MEPKIEGITTTDSDLKEQISFCFELSEGLPKYFTAADFAPKRQILDSIFSEKLVFGKKSYRTVKFRKLVSLICRPGKDYKEGRKKESPEFSELSNRVPRTGFEPARPCEHHHLKVACLPVSTPGLHQLGSANIKAIFSKQYEKLYPCPALKPLPGESPGDTGQ